MKAAQETKFWPMMLTMFLGSFVVMLSSSTINIALPYLITTLHTDLNTAKWTVTGFMLTMATSAPLAASLGEKFSYKRLYLFSLAGFAAVSSLVLLSSNIYILIATRVLQGLFGGVTVPATMAMVYQVVPKKRLVTAISVWSIAPTLAPAVGPTIGGFLINSLDWRAIFLINVPCGVLAIILAIRYLPHYRVSADDFSDSTGLSLSVVSSTALLIAFSEGSIWGWTSTTIMCLLVVGAVSLVLFILWELCAKNPVLNLRTFRYPKFTVSVVISCIINVALYSGTFLTPIFLQNIQGLKPLDAALVLLPAAICMAVLMPVVGAVYRRIGVVPMLLVGISLIALGTWRMAQLSVSTPHSYVRLWMALRYIGLAVATLPASNAGMTTLPKELSGYGSSILNWMKQMFACLSLGVFSSVLTSRALHHVAVLSQNAHPPVVKEILVGKGYTMGINDIYLISCIIVLLALPFSLLFKKRRSEVPDLPEPVMVGRS